MAGANSGNNNLGSGNGNNADPFEEFEFRPINEGLGFHRKQKNQSNSPTSMPSAGTPTVRHSGTFSTSAGASSPLNSSNTTPRNNSYDMSGGMTDLAAPNANGLSPFQSPLPRHDSKKANSFSVPTIEDDSIAKAQTAVNDILKTLNQKRQLDFVSETARLKGEVKKSKPHFFAATLDAMLITAAFLMSLILMLSITKVDLFMNLTHPNTSGLVYLATAALFLGVTFIYMVVNRTFLGASPGEWAFEQMCGMPKQTEEVSYVPRIALRTLVVMLTGFIVLPILSYLLNKDVAGDIAGVSLFKKPGT